MVDGYVNKNNRSVNNGRGSGICFDSVSFDIPHIDVVCGIIKLYNISRFSF